MSSRRMMRHGFIAALIMATAVSPLVQGADPVSVDPEFKKLDVNGDGYISDQEARGLTGLPQALREVDDDRDGRLNPDEFVKAQALRERLIAARVVDDSLITARVKAALLKDPQVSGLAVSVETYKGTVLLSGFVESSAQAKRAVEIASGVRGVSQVKSGLFTKS